MFAGHLVKISRHHLSWRTRNGVDNASCLVRYGVPKYTAINHKVGYRYGISCKVSNIPFTFYLKWFVRSSKGLMIQIVPEDPQQSENIYICGNRAKECFGEFNYRYFLPHWFWWKYGCIAYQKSVYFIVVHPVTTVFHWEVILPLIHIGIYLMNQWKYVGMLKLCFCLRLLLRKITCLSDELLFVKVGRKSINNWSR